MGTSLSSWIVAARPRTLSLSMTPVAVGAVPSMGRAAKGALPLALIVIRRFAREPPERGFNRILAQTAQTQFVFAELLCLGLVL